MNYIKPYYKYKKDAYSNLLNIINTILSEGSVFILRPEISGKELNISYDVSRNIPGDIVVSYNGSWLVTLNVNTLLISSPSIYQMRNTLTHKECQAIKETIKVLFKDGNSTVLARFGNLVHDWFVNGEECYFMSFDGTAYRNRGA